ncbi:ROK family protein [Pontibacter harenae]|uniref:ROK family protein n=1 Tax=Pontibacter harenae TaxID=2894083 RepID=UPI001E520A49|nr:ROK family protein [Pontibacter harenae]MCC9165777.1 ROK family protein [Pontibacter harenae]
MNDNIVVGIDIGGSHIAAALVNLEDRMLLPNSYTRKEVNSSGTAEEIIAEWSQVVKDVVKDCSDSSLRLGIAMPGPFNYEDGISLIKNQNKFDLLYKLNIRELLGKELLIKNENIRFMNDAGCFLQGEAFCGAARTYSSAIGLTLGTGLGSSRYMNGVAQDADLWNTPFKDGIAEDYLSTRWFVNRCYDLYGRMVEGVKELVDLVEKLPVAKSIFEEFGENLGQFLAYFIQLDKPEAVILGGNIAKSHPLFLPSLINYLDSSAVQVTIKLAELGEEAALIGAVSCWSESNVTI